MDLEVTNNSLSDEPEIVWCQWEREKEIEVLTKVKQTVPAGRLDGGQRNKVLGTSGKHFLPSRIRCNERKRNLRYWCKN